MKVIKRGPLGPKNYPPVLKSEWHDTILSRFIDQHLEDERKTYSELIVQNGKLWYALAIMNNKRRFTIKVPL